MKAIFLLCSVIYTVFKLKKRCFIDWTDVKPILFKGWVISEFGSAVRDRAGALPNLYAGHGCGLDDSADPAHLAAAGLALCGLHFGKKDLWLMGYS